MTNYYFGKTTITTLVINKEIVVRFDALSPLRLICYCTNTLCLRAFVRTNSYFSGVGIDLYWERWICLLLVGGTTSVSSGTDA